MTKRWLAKIKILARSKRNQRIALLGLAAFIVLNLIIGLIYHSRTLPLTKIGGKNLSNLSFADVDKRLAGYRLLPDKIKLYYKDKQATYKTASLGLSLDSAKIIESAKQRPWLPVLYPVYSQNIPIHTRLDEAKFSKQAKSITETFKSDATNAEIVINQGLFTMKPEADGYKLEANGLKQSLSASQTISQGRVELRVTVLKPSIKQSSLKADLKKLQKQQKTSITFHFQNNAVQLTSQEISALYAKSGTTYTLSDQLVKAKIASLGQGFGIKVQNISEAVAAVKDSLAKNEALDFTLAQLVSTRTYSYCVQARGVDAANLPAFEAKLASTYADTRGWSLGGQIKFVKVDSGCSFTAWLAAADQVPGFGSICDNTWSCTVSPNVIINYDRWAGASDSWNAAGGSLEDYRSMVINHETGHWLGFGHKYCSGAGQLAPVMQQQSIDLQGCTFNPWPLPSELASLRGWLGF